MGAKSIVSPLAGTIVAVPEPIAENVNPVPGVTVLAGGRVMIYEPKPTRQTMEPAEADGMVAVVLNTSAKGTDMPLPTAHAVAAYFATMVSAALE
jgi:hypothetical protein